MPTKPLDPDNIDQIVTCCECRSPLWRMRVLKREGNSVLSHEFLPVSGKIRPWSDKNMECPICLRDFLQVVDHGKELRIRLQDPTTGEVRFV